MINTSVAQAHAAFMRCAAIVAQTTGVSMRDIVSPLRPGRPRRSSGSPQAFARRAAVYLTVAGLNVRQGTLARALGRHRRRILDDMTQIETMRDLPGIDSLFDRMEAML